MRALLKTEKWNKLRYCTLRYYTYNTWITDTGKDVKFKKTHSSMHKTSWLSLRECYLRDSFRSTGEKMMNIIADDLQKYKNRK